MDMSRRQDGHQGCRKNQHRWQGCDTHSAEDLHEEGLAGVSASPLGQVCGLEPCPGRLGPPCASGKIGPPRGTWRTVDRARCVRVGLGEDMEEKRGRLRAGEKRGGERQVRRKEEERRDMPPGRVTTSSVGRTWCLSRTESLWYLPRSGPPVSSCPQPQI